MEQQYLTVLDLDDYTIRKDQKSLIWFRFNNDFMTDPDNFYLDCKDISVWLYLLSYCSKKQTNQVLIDTKIIGFYSRVQESEVMAILEKLQQLQRVRIKKVTEKEPYVDNFVQGTDLCSTIQNKQDRTDKKSYSRERVRGDLETLLTEWKTTLNHFLIERDTLAGEDTQVLDALKKHGFDAVKLALIGARREQKTQSFDPSKHVKLYRYLGPNFEKFVNLGAQDKDVDVKNNPQYQKLLETWEGDIE